MNTTVITKAASKLLIDFLFNFFIVFKLSVSAIYFFLGIRKSPSNDITPSKHFTLMTNNIFYSITTISETIVVTAKKPVAPSLRLDLGFAGTISNGPPRHSVSDSIPRKNSRY